MAGDDAVVVTIMSQLLASRHHVDTAKAVQVMAAALDRVAGEEAIERLIGDVLALDLDDEQDEISAGLILHLREIQATVAAVVSTAAVAVRAAEKRHGEGPRRRSEGSHSTCRRPVRATRA